MNRNRNCKRYASTTAISVFLLFAAVIGLAVLYSEYPGKILDRGTRANNTQPARYYPEPRMNGLSPHLLSQRPLFPYSIIPGGVDSSAELTRAISTDPVVAHHYSDFDLAKSHVTLLDKESAFYVSYRIGNSIFWTRKALTLHKGEAVLSDGLYAARTRCGNRLSATQQLPVSKQEPAQEAFEKAQNEVPPAIETAMNLPIMFRPLPNLVPIENQFMNPIEPFVPYSPSVWWPPFIPIEPPQPNPPPPPPVPPPPVPISEPGTATLLSMGLLALCGAAGAIWYRRAGNAR